MDDPRCLAYQNESRDITIDREQRCPILFQAADGGGERGREAGGESADAVPAGRGARQGGISDDGYVRASGWRVGVQPG